MEELLVRHRKEARDLQARVTQKKKSATKKTRKGVNDECAALEDEMKLRHAKEIAELASPGNDEESENEEAGAEPAAETAAEIEKLSLSDKAEKSEEVNEKVRKPNRQKARLARRAAEQEALAASAAEEAKLQPDRRKQEIAAMQAHFEKHGLVEKDIRPDGHCLYASVADQLKELNIGLTPKITLGEPTNDEKDYWIVRKAAGDYMSQHQDDYAPFLEEPFDEYVSKVTGTAEWGGQLELMALAKTYGVDINVLQNDGRVETFKGSDRESPTLWVAYYRHSFGLGEHYNSLRKAP
jgi:OTU domain-containing protein 6